ncbi:glycoside hydrolase family 32 protein [Marinilabilia rubra]|nr:glycoside hydrolase family 32 protein [Marinilabilia rubra]
MRNYFLLFFFAALISGCGNVKQDDLYKKQHRPQIHFSPKENWMNDPNGLVYYQGEYHLFYQYNPDSTVWGPMHWGHAISEDLIHWEHLPVALKPDSLGYIFSGSAVVDHNNTSGLGREGVSPMIAIFTYHNQKKADAGELVFQNPGIAYSLDKGRSWEKYSDNPVLENPGFIDFRDPKVFWHAATDKWIMSLAAGDHIRFYSSSNMLKWNFESEFGLGVGSHIGVWECPDLFSVSVSETDEKKWVLLVSVNEGAPNGGSGTQYFVGDFDGESFDPVGEDEDVKTKWVDYGKDNYAGVTWSGITENDGRRVFMGWMNNWQYAEQIPTDGWRGAFTLPRELELVNSYGDYLLKSQPVSEYDQLRKDSQKIAGFAMEGEMEVVDRQELPLELKLTFDVRDHSSMNFAEKFGVRLLNDKGESLAIGYNNVDKLFFVDRRNAGWDSSENNFSQINYAPYILNQTKLDFHLIIDKSSVEMFAVDGLVTMTERFFPSQDFSKIEFFTEGGRIEIIEGELSLLERVW